MTDALLELRLADPYRWLEDGSDPAVQAWQAEQNDRTAAHLADWPHLEPLRRSLARLAVPPLAPFPVRVGDREFRLEAHPDGMRLVVVDEPGAGGRVLLDAAGLATPAPTLLWLSPSLDGELVAVGVCHDGSERNTIHLVRTRSGERLPAPPLPLMDALSGGAWWLPDGSGFCFSAVEDTETDLVHSPHLHLIGPATTTRLDVPWTTERDYRCVRPSRDGRWLVAVERMLDPVPVAVAELGGPGELTWVPFVRDSGMTLAGHLVGNRYVGITDLGAPRGRVVAVDLDAPEPSSWTTLMPESAAVLRRLDLVGDVLVVGELHNTWSGIRLLGVDGRALGELPLPGRGAVREAPYPFPNLMARPYQDDYVFAFSTPTSSPGVYRWRPGHDQVEELVAPAVVLEDVVVEDLKIAADDGVELPTQLVRKRDSHGPVATLLYAYGAFGTPVAPGYSAVAAAVVAAGGAYVLAHPRGGGDLGRGWWEAARFERKQRTYDDIYAVAEWLHRSDRTSPDKLALTGDSAGGLLSAVAVTQRPDLWAAVVARVPSTDLLANLDDRYGRMVLSLELADVDDPRAVGDLVATSPYHLVTRARYPATLLLAGEDDPRCPPWHSRKLIASMQEQQRGSAPVLLSVLTGAGHGLAGGSGLRDPITQSVAFVMVATGLVPSSA